MHPHARHTFRQRAPFNKSDRVDAPDEAPLFIRLARLILADSFPIRATLRKRAFSCGPTANIARCNFRCPRFQSVRPSVTREREREFGRRITSPRRRRSDELSSGRVDYFQARATQDKTRYARTISRYPGIGNFLRKVSSRETTMHTRIHGGRAIHVVTFSDYTSDGTDEFNEDRLTSVWHTWMKLWT